MSKESHADDYELLPVKPIQDLRREVKALRREIQKGSSYEKLIVKHLNLNISLNRKVNELADSLNKTNQKMETFIEMVSKAFEEEEEIDEHAKRIEAVANKLQVLAEQHTKVTDMIGGLSNDIKANTFKQSSRGSPLVYRRTKSL